MVATTLRVKTIYRTIAKRADADDGPLPVTAVDEYLSSFYDKGYVLVAAHYVGEDEFNFRMVYVLHRPEGK